MLHKLPFFHIPIGSLFVVIMVFSVISIVSFLCSSHKTTKTKKQSERRTARLDEKKPVVSRLKSNISSKALLMAKMISWKKVQDARGDEQYGYGYDDGEEAVWKRTIIKGEKCQPLDFSGKILYDCQGNILPDSPHPSHCDRQ